MASVKRHFAQEIDLVFNESNISKLMDKHSNANTTINFNCANMCRMPPPVLKQIHELQRAMVNTPYHLYRLRDELVPEIKRLISELHPDVTNKHIHLTFSSTIVANYLAKMFRSINKKPLFLTLPGEHEGAKLPFQAFTNLVTCKNFEELVSIATEKQNEISGFMLSSIRHDNGNYNDLKRIHSIREKYCNRAVIIADLAQNFSVNPIQFEYFDIGFASTHKWLSGAMGHGVLWLSKDWNEILLSEKLVGTCAQDNEFGFVGGGDFLGLVEDYVSLKIRLEHKKGYNRLFETCEKPINLTNYGSFADNNKSFFKLCLDDVAEPYVLYRSMLENDLDVKLIMEYSPILRVTVPYFLDQNEIEVGMQIINSTIGEHLRR